MLIIFAEMTKFYDWGAQSACQRLQQAARLAYLSTAKQSAEHEHPVSVLYSAGLELFFVDAAAIPGTSVRTPSVFFAFRSEIDRDRATRAIAQQPGLGTNLPGGRAVASACGSILEVSSACCWRRCCDLGTLHLCFIWQCHVGLIVQLISCTRIMKHISRMY